MNGLRLSKNAKPIKFVVMAAVLLYNGVTLTERPFKHHREV